MPGCKTILICCIEDAIMKKHTWLEFEDDDKLNAFMRFILGFSPVHSSTSGNARVGSGFTKKQIEIAKKDFGARVVERPE